jgi:hypothetical protein
LFNPIDQGLSLIAPEPTIEAKYVRLIVVTKLNGIDREGTPWQQLTHLHSSRLKKEKEASDVGLRGNGRPRVLKQALSSFSMQGFRRGHGGEHLP